MNTRGSHWREVNVGAGNDLVQSGNKPLLEPVLTKISDAGRQDDFF